MQQTTPGRDWRQLGRELAAEEVNASGGVLGGKLVLKVADDATDPNTARQVWEKLVNEGVHAVIFRDITRTQEFRVCIWPEYCAISYKNPQTGELEGIDMDVANQF